MMKVDLITHSLFLMFFNTFYFQKSTKALKKSSGEKFQSFIYSDRFFNISHKQLINVSLSNLFTFYQSNVCKLFQAQKEPGVYKLTGLSYLD